MKIAKEDEPMHSKQGLIWAMTTLLFLSGPAAHEGLGQSPLSFFPHHLGDVWQRSVSPVSWQNIINKDSLGADGRYYVEMSVDGKLRVDTTTFEVHGRFWGGEVYSNLVYRLNSALGDGWTVSREGITVQANVASVYSISLFGEPVVVKKIDFVDSASQLLLITDYLASEFGLIGQDIDAMSDWRLLGARINGVEHGYVVSVSEGNAEVPNQSFVLYQNYPNPFNPATQISYEVKRQEYVSLKVYDLVGREITTLVNEVQSPGEYHVTWEGISCASGTYLYRLQTTIGSVTRRMILLR